MIKDINQEIAERIKGSSEAIKTTVINKFVNDEVTRRADLLSRLIVAINEFRKASLRIKADVITFTSTGEVASESWSKAQLDKKKKSDEKLAKAEKAFEKALNDNDYGAVEQAINELKVDKAQKSEGEEGVSPAS